MDITVDQMIPLLFWIPIVSVFFNFLLITFLIIVIQKGKLKPKEQQEIEKQMMETVKQAETRTTEIIEAATYKAREIVKDAQGTKQLINEKINKLINDTADVAQNELDHEKATIVAKFKESYSGLVEQFEGETQSLIASLQHDSREIRKTFADSVQKATVDVLKDLKNTAEHQMVNVDNEIKDYRENTFKKIDEHANAIIKQIVTEYFNSEITPKNHESILNKTFEKFKEQVSHKV